MTPSEQVFHLTQVPPSTNGLFASVGKRRIRSRKYQEWAEASAWELKAARPRKILDDVAVMVELRRPRAGCDVDNRLKAAVDLLTGIVLADDRQVVDVRARWADIDGCRVTVRVVATEGAE